MNPILYQPRTTDFSNNGVGVLSDCISCQVTEERNGMYELQAEYPVDGIHYDEICTDAVIKAKANELSNPQLFQVYYVSRPINGIITINAEHISYRLRHIPVSPFTANSAVTALNGIKTNSATTNPFTFSTDIVSTGNFTVKVPTACRSLLGGVDGSVLDTWNGEYEFDNFNVTLKRNRGADNGVSILYGKNLIDATQEENISSAITGIYPFWKGADDTLVTLPEKIITIASQYSFPRIVPMDFSSNFQEMPTVDQIRTTANDYIMRSGISAPKISITVDFVQLWQTVGYEDIAALERVSLCDTVTVKFDKIGINAKAKVIKTVYDTLADKYISIELGDAKNGLAETIVQQQKEQEKAPTVSFMEKAINNATNLITGQSGGYVVLNPAENPQEILIMNTPNINTATKVWRWNSGGLGYSKTGYNGPYETAITMDGQILGKFIAALTIAGNQIISGLIKSTSNPNIYFDLDAGEIRASKLISENGVATAYIGYYGGEGINTHGIKLNIDGSDVLFLGDDGLHSLEGEAHGLVLKDSEVKLAKSTSYMRDAFRLVFEDDVIELFAYYEDKSFSRVTIQKTGITIVANSANVMTAGNSGGQKFVTINGDLHVNGNIYQNGVKIH